VEAFKLGDLDEVGRLFYASHSSLRDLYEVSSPELDALVEIAQATPGVVGARLTGAGFGGCTINLVRHDAVDAFREAVLRDYPARTGLVPRVFVVEASTGAARIL
jgi:galactokinase